MPIPETLHLSAQMLQDLPFNPDQEFSHSYRESAHSNQELSHSDREHSNPHHIVVTDQTATQALLEAAGKTAILNFASATNPGGGFLSGANAQEEALCRCSNLYMGLKDQTAFYLKGKDHPKGHLEYTDDILYSKDVCFFKDDQGSLLMNSVFADVITCAAPNLHLATRKLLDQPGAYRKLLTRRAEGIIKAANDNKIETLILGAWGCGVFGNDPKMIAQVFRDVLKHSHARTIVFPVPFSKANLQAFQTVFLADPIAEDDSARP